MKIIVLCQFTKDIRSRSFFVFEDLTKAYEFIVKSCVSTAWRESQGKKESWVLEKDVYQYVEALEELAFLINEEKEPQSKFEYYDKDWIKKSMSYHVRQLLSKD
eukprot:TRINITY_DN12732_c0_g2_i1.p1 TRINITY_DN12732_c0_g2~~TRINITY_DN12732_c0_g2_i1.p1  ORF type:complete len:104 (+),score=14.83 TRINITY_DN12732_c0_g2_i1:67-378(+)